MNYTAMLGDKLYRRENNRIKKFSYEAKKGDSWINATIIESREKHNEYE